MKLKQMILTATAGWLSAGAALAGGNCAPRDVVIERLVDHFGETRRSMGLGSSDTVVEVFASAESGTWTITVTNPRGLTCLVAAGKSFEVVEEALPTKGDDT